MVHPAFTSVPSSELWCRRCPPPLGSASYSRAGGLPARRGECPGCAVTCPEIGGTTSSGIAEGSHASGGGDKPPRYDSTRVLARLPLVSRAQQPLGQLGLAPESCTCAGIRGRWPRAGQRVAANRRKPDRPSTPPIPVIGPKSPL